MSPPSAGIARRHPGERWAKLSTKPGAELPVIRLWITPVKKRKATEQTAPPKPMIPAQNSVTCNSVGWARSLNQTKNLSRRNDAPLRPDFSDSTDAADTL